MTETGHQHFAKLTPDIYKISAIFLDLYMEMTYNSNVLFYHTYNFTYQQRIVTPQNFGV